MKEEEEELTRWEQEIEMYNVEWASPTTPMKYWYTNVHQYLEHGTMPSKFSTQKKRALWIKALSYQLVHGVLLRKHHNGVLLKCLEANDSEKVLRYIHDRPSKGHFVWNTTTHKIMWASFYWPTLFKYAHAYSHKCPVCQRCADRNQKLAAHCSGRTFSTVGLV